MTAKYLIFIFTAFICILNQNAIAQNKTKDPFDKLNRKYEARLNKMNADYQGRLEKMQHDYDEHLKSMNAAFKNYLKSNFEEVDQNKSQVKPTEVPKPIDQPVFQPITTTSPNKKPAPIPKPIIPKIALAEAPAYSIAPILQLPEDAKNYIQELNINFLAAMLLFILTLAQNHFS